VWPGECPAFLPPGTPVKFVIAEHRQRRHAAPARTKCHLFRLRMLAGGTAVSTDNKRSAPLHSSSALSAEEEELFERVTSR